MESSRRAALLERLQTGGLLVAVLLALTGAVSMLVGLFGGGSETMRSGRNLEGNGTRVEVLNAAGVPGLAKEGTRRLRDAGFDVVYFGNAGGAARAESVVLDRAGNLQTARLVAKALNISQVRSVPNPDLFLEASVVLGKDWQQQGANRR